MGRPFGDITLYLPTRYPPETPEYWEDRSLWNFICDLYVRKMHGYKPPNASRVCIQTAQVTPREKTWKFGAVFSIVCEFVRDRYESLDRHAKYHYILNIIQDAVIQLSVEYHWDKVVFENAYQEIIKGDFAFNIDYPTKMSRDRRKRANLRVEKNETTTFVYAIIETGGAIKKVKLFEKKNGWCDDGIYPFAKYAKWIDADKFGIYYSKGLIEIYYSIMDDEVRAMESGNPVQVIKFPQYSPL